MKAKLKSYEFWVSIVGAVTVLLQSLSTKLNVPYVSECAMALLGALAVWGILKKSTTVDTKKEDTAKETQQEEDMSDRTNDDVKKT